MKRILYLVLSLLSIVYILFLIVDLLRASHIVNFDLGWFEEWFGFVVQFGGVGIICVFAFINFFGNPLKMVFFVLLAVVAGAYVALICITKFFDFDKLHAIASAVQGAKCLWM